MSQEKTETLLPSEEAGDLGFEKKIEKIQKIREFVLI